MITKQLPIMLLIIFAATTVGSAQNQILEEAPGKYPSDHDLMKMRHSSVRPTWSDYYSYFMNELPKYKDEHYYDNLEWMNLYYIISEDDLFTSEADFETKEYLWKRIMERNFVNVPRHAVSLLNSMKSYLKPQEYIERLQAITTINDQYFKNQPGNYLQFKERHKETLAEMLLMEYLIGKSGKYPESFK